MPRKHEAMKRTQHYITLQQQDKLGFLSEVTGCGVSEHLRRALDAYFTLPHIQQRLRAMPKPKPPGPREPTEQLELPLEGPDT